MASTERITEPARSIDVLGAYDVVVCGGGPAGCSAALASARHGARTLLIEKEGYLGGAPCTQLVCVFLSTNGVDLEGVWHEFFAELDARDGVRPFTGSAAQGGMLSAIDPEQVKYTWDHLLTSAGVSILHHTYSTHCIIEDGRAIGVFVESRSGRQAIRAGCVIDTTGDGTVAAQSGVAFTQGDGTHPWAMAMTKPFRMGNVYRPADWPNSDALHRIEEQLSEAIARGEYNAPILTEKSRFLGYVTRWCYALPGQRTELLSISNRILQVDPLDLFATSAAERDGREQARQTADALRRFVPGFENAYLLDTSNQIGIRSSRRLHGQATVRDSDAWDFVKYADGVAKSSWHVDIWPPDSQSRPAVPHDNAAYRQRRERMRNGDYFNIRYGCLVPQGIDNLLMAGRCISAEHMAQASLRIQQTCMATGQAAGTAAALCTDQDVLPRALEPETLVKQLESDRARVARFNLPRVNQQPPG